MSAVSRYFKSVGVEQVMVCTVICVLLQYKQVNNLKNIFLNLIHHYFGCYVVIEKKIKLARTQVLPVTSQIPAYATLPSSTAYGLI